MANDQRKPKSWMNPTGGGAKNPAPSQKRGWHPTTQAAKPAEGRKRSRLLPALAGAVLLVGIVIALLQLERYHPPRLIPIAPSNTGTLASSPNWTGFNSAMEVTKWAGEGRSRPKVAQEPAVSVKKDEWAAGLNGPEDVFVLFFCLHGGADSKGAYLWLMPPEAGSPDDSYKLRLTAVLDKLAEYPEKKKVLFLDATQVTASLAQGMLHNDFAHEVRKLDGRIHDIPNLVVICASKEDQRSWYSEEWQRTIFTHFLIEGASGAAKTDRVSVEQLFKFVEKKVSTWVRSNRDEDQTPFLLPTTGGMELAKKIKLASVSSSSYSAPTPPGAKFEAPRELEAAWEECEKIGNRSPQANAPHHWRRHLDTMLRIESLLRAGAPVADMVARLAVLKSNEPRLTTNPWPNLTSLPNSVAMPTAVAAKPPKPLIDRDQFQLLWKAPAKVWPDLRASVSPAEVPQLRLDVCAQLINFLITDDKRPESLNQAASGTKEKPGLLFSVLEGSTAPVEAQLLLLLDRDLTADRPEWPMIQLALEMHRLAEQTALLGGASAQESPYSELVFPWIKEAVAKADEERLRGTDLLIRGKVPDWQEGNKRLTEAKRQYLAIGERAGQIRRALEARNKALAELPYFARWVAGLRDEFANEPGRPELLLKLVEAIALDMHQVTSLLEGADLSELPKLNATAKNLAARLEELRIAFFVDFLPKLGAKENPSQWHHIDNALQVPFIRANQRMQLLTSLRRISKKLNDDSESVGTAESGRGSDGAGSGGAAPSKAQERALRQGRIALALLGSTWVDDTDSQKALKGYKFEVMQNMMLPSPSWREAVREAGEQIGWHWRTLATRVDSLTDEAKTDQLEPALKSLSRADSLARMLDSATSLAPDHDPVADYRRHRLHWFLLDQAQRTIYANWAAADPNAEQAKKPTFAEETGRRFVADADELIMKGAAAVPSLEDKRRLEKEVRPLSERLVKLPTVEVRAPNRYRDVTSRPRIDDLEFLVQIPAGQPAGFPVLRLTSKSPCRLEGTPVPGTPMTTFAEQNKKSVQLRLSAALEASTSNEPGSVTAEVWHRGHHRSETIIVKVNNTPSGSWAYHTPQGDPAFIPRAGEEMRKGTVAILLDWTRSMVVPKERNKYIPAVDALETLLAELPEDTNIAFMQFGDRDDKTKATMPFSSPITGLYCGKRYRDKRNELLEKLREKANEPDAGYTPLARSIVEMAEYMSRLNAPGTKTMVVLTDGEDNVTKNPGKWLVKELENYPIPVNIVFFQAEDEEQRALDQFNPILHASPPGALYTAKRPDELRDNLRDALIPRIVVLNHDGSPRTGLETKGQVGVKVLTKGTGLTGPVRIPRGSYGFKVAGSASTNAVLFPGDRLYLGPYFKDGRVVIGPLPYIPTIVPKNLRESSNVHPDVHAALADAHLEDGKAGPPSYDLVMLVLMERQHTPDPLEVTRPQFAWIEVRAEGDDPKGPARMAWVENVNYLPCSAFRVVVPNWPALPGKRTAFQGSPSPVVSVYWVSAWPGGAARVTREAGQQLADAFKEPINVGGATIKYEVRFEGDSLIVDLRYKPGAPVVFVRLEGIDDQPRLTINQDHRFFDETGQYSARFSRVDENRQGQKFDLVFYSMDELRRSAASITLSPNLKLDLSPPLGQATPSPIEFDK